MIRTAVNIMALVAACSICSSLSAQTRYWNEITGGGPSPREAPSLTYDAARSVSVLFGGSELLWFFNAETWTYNGSHWFQHNTSGGPGDRSLHAAAFDAQHGEVVVFGGEGPQGRLGDTWTWDGATWTERTGVGGPGPRAAHSMAYDSSRGVVVLHGGWNGGPDLGDTWEWNGATWMLRSTGGPPMSDHALVYDEFRGVVVAVGKRETWEWDGSSWAFRTAAGPSSRWAHSMVFDSLRGVSILFGGISEFSGPPLRETWEWNGLNWTLRDQAGPPAQFWHRMAFDSARSVTVLYGGPLENNFERRTTACSTWEWNGFAWTVVQSCKPPAQTTPHLVFDAARNSSVLVGNDPTVSMLDQQHWEWTGNAWLKRNAFDTFLRFIDFAMCYDSTREVPVIFGGIRWGGAPSDDTLEYDEGYWQVRFPATRPSPRAGAALAFDETRHHSVLFGGANEQGLLGDTWRWDGTTWSPRASAGPSPRWHHSMCYDSNRDVVVLFGGESDDGPVTDTWEWNGASWVQKASFLPVLGELSTMTYDSARCVSVLVSVGGLPSALWEWNGQIWLPRTDGSEPPLFDTPALSYDSIRGETVLFGGDYGGEWARQTWLYTGPCPDPQINGAPSSAAVCLGSPVTLSVQAVGSCSLEYQWRHNSANIPGATAASYSIDQFSAPNTGYYDCVVTDICSSVVTTPAELTAGLAPAIVEQPSDRNVCVDGTATFSIGASGSPVLSYQWRRGTVALLDGQSISGANTALLTISPVTTDDASDDYNCAVSNSCGLDVSNSASLIVCSNCSADLNCDCSIGLDDLSVLLANFGLNEGATHADGDTDGDGDIDLVDLAIVLASFGVPCL